MTTDTLWTMGNSAHLVARPLNNVSLSRLYDLVVELAARLQIPADFLIPPPFGGLGALPFVQQHLFRCGDADHMDRIAQRRLELDAE